MVTGPGKVELVYKPANGGKPVVYEVHDFNDSGGVAMGMYNTDEVCIEDQTSCVQYCSISSLYFLHSLPNTFLSF